jgi:hypothetical protein
VTKGYQRVVQRRRREQDAMGRAIVARRRARIRAQRLRGIPEPSTTVDSALDATTTRMPYPPENLGVPKSALFDSRTTSPKPGSCRERA